MKMKAVNHEPVNPLKGAPALQGGEEVIFMAELLAVSSSRQSKKSSVLSVERKAF